MKFKHSNCSDPQISIWMQPIKPQVKVNVSALYNYPILTIFRGLFFLLWGPVDFFDALSTRKACRYFQSDKPVPGPVLEKILLAASCSASSKNVQPWRISLLQGSALSEFRDEYTKKFDEKAEPNPPFKAYPEPLPDEWLSLAREVGYALFAHKGIDESHCCPMKFPSVLLPLVHLQMNRLMNSNPPAGHYMSGLKSYNRYYFKQYYTSWIRIVQALKIWVVQPQLCNQQKIFPIQLYFGEDYRDKNWINFRLDWSDLGLNWPVYRAKKLNRDNFSLRFLIYLRV